MLLGVVLVLSPLVSACASATPEIIEKEVIVERVVTATKEVPTKTPKPPTPTPPPPSLLEVVEGEFPLWNREDFEDTMSLLQIAQVSKTFMNDPKDPKTRPPYYKGQQPLNYTAYRNPLTTVERLAPIELAYIFDEFDNYFFHKGWFFGMSEGAITVDKTGEHLLAEAQLLEISDDSVVEIFEVHYNLDGKPIFTCKSRFDRRGFKVSERDQRGKKETDYYFIWPMGYMGYR